jgi:pilus assembly protein CpaE
MSTFSPIRSKNAGGRSSESPIPAPHRDPEALGTNILSAALIGPDEHRRREMISALAASQAGSIREFSSYPELDDVPALVAEGFEVIIVELDSDPERAFDLVELICSISSVTVMVYSAQSDSELLVRCMRAGAREFLTPPITPSVVAEAMVRASVRRPVGRAPKKTTGRILVFAGVKGGCGVTTVATNFAISLARESGQRTLLIDLALPMGDAALDLGISGQFSTVNAIQNFSRLDSNFLSKLLIKHSSGLSVLQGPDKYSPIEASNEAIEKLLAIAKQDFEYVVVDVGSGVGSTARALFALATKVYLIAQVSVSELRNSNRLISEFFPVPTPNLEIVLNRFVPRVLGIDEENITKALTRPAKWKIPGDYPAARRAQNTATPLALEDSPISRVITKMARVACGLPEEEEKKKRFALFK